jgi:signal transduction histidine kinase
VGPRDEIRDLADTFDAMLERLDRSFDGQRRFIALASHELRTPLTITRTVLEVALDDPATPAETRALGDRLLGVTARHERLIDGLLTLAVAEQAPAAAEDADLADLARTVVAQAAGEAGRAGVAVEADLAPAPVTGDPLLLERLVQNLVDNAVRHNAQGGFVTVRTGPAGGAGGGPGGHGVGASVGAEVVVENSGPVVPPDAVPALTEPFHQHGGGPGADAARRRHRALDGGAGLGLSIVAAVATAHAGTLHLAPRPAGGLRATVTLPGGVDAGAVTTAAAARPAR